MRKCIVITHLKLLWKLPNGLDTAVPFSGLVTDSSAEKCPKVYTVVGFLPAECLVQKMRKTIRAVYKENDSTLGCPGTCAACC